MNQTLLKELNSRFRVKTSAMDRYSNGRSFMVFDRDEANRPGWCDVPPDGIKSHWRSLLSPMVFCEVNVYGGSSDASTTVELSNVYDVCRKQIEKLAQDADGCVDDSGRHWVARLEVQMTKQGEDVVRQLADTVRAQRRRTTRSRHRLANLADALTKLADAIRATASCLSLMNN